ncbi:MULTISPECIES: DUF6767 domain-containing protein [unclassified Nocardioides]|uniref:DUF6767 domain-containing protein n=1 Tax=unclassified Nocardioides TaxID=2615069 RepID=UPI0030155E9C
MGRPVPQCPIRPGEPCSLCEPGATGPQDCGLVWLVMTDPELRERLAELRSRARTGVTIVPDAGSRVELARTGTPKVRLT